MDKKEEFIGNLSNDISNDVGSITDEELSTISSTFTDTLNKALSSYGSVMFNDRGILEALKNYDSKNDDNNSMIKNIVNGFKDDFTAARTRNQSELLLRKDLKDVCEQMPELQDTVGALRDSIIECNVATGEVSRNITFDNQANASSETLESIVHDIEQQHDLKMLIKNDIIPNMLKLGEYYAQVVPYSKLFSELKIKQQIANGSNKYQTENGNINTPENLKILTESMSHISKLDIDEEESLNNNSKRSMMDSQYAEKLEGVLESVTVRNGSSVLIHEYGDEAIAKFISDDKRSAKEIHFIESMIDSGSIDLDDAIASDLTFNDIKGCYVHFLDPLRMIPIRIGRKIIGYYYATIDNNISELSNSRSGVTDLSFREFSRDHKMVSSLANIIMSNFDEKVLSKNIKLKHEIVEIIMAHKFDNGKLSFVYIPESEIVRFSINDDASGRGHSIIEPGIFPARMYILLTMYNALYILNNTTTRMHYVKSSGLSTDYSNVVQRTMRKFQDRRVGMNDIYSFAGALNKIGGSGELILPAGKGDMKAIETDTIEAVNMPIAIEFIEMQRRQALVCTGMPQNMIINAIDDIDFSRTLELANARYLRTVSSYKIDCNRGITKLYQKILRYESNMNPEDIQSFKFAFNSATQHSLNITTEMINSFNEAVTLIGSLYYRNSELEDAETGNPTNKSMVLRKELAKKYLPQLDYDELDLIINSVNISAGALDARDKDAGTTVEDEEIDSIVDDYGDEMSGFDDDEYDMSDDGSYDVGAQDDIDIDNLDNEPPPDAGMM